MAPLGLPITRWFHGARARQPLRIDLLIKTIAIKKVDGRYGTESCRQRMEKDTSVHRDTGPPDPCVLACRTREHAPLLCPTSEL
jgi:hypothetical protein